MGFYASHSAYRLLVRAARLAEAKEAIRSILDGEGDEIAAQGRGADVLELDIDPRGALDEPWPEGDRPYSLGDQASAVLEQCEDGSYVEWFNGDEFIYERLEKTGGETAWRISEPFASWHLA